MYRFWSFILTVSIMVPFVRTTHKYTKEECKIKCKKDYGTLYPPSLNSVEWTRPFVYPDGKCACHLNADALQRMFEALGLSYDDFLKWNDRGVCFGRMWLSKHKIKVEKMKGPSMRQIRKQIEKEACEREKQTKAAKPAPSPNLQTGQVYTLKSCEYKCNEDEGYIVVVPGNRIPITVPNLSKDGKKCTCNANVAPVYKFLKEKGLDADAFFRTRNINSACGRKWLLQNNIRVDFEKTLKEKFKDEDGELSLSQRFEEADEGRDGICDIDSIPPQRAEWTRKGRVKPQGQRTAHADPESVEVSSPQNSSSSAGTSKAPKTSRTETARPPTQPTKHGEIEELGSE